MTEKKMIQMMRKNNIQKWIKKHPDENISEEFGKRIAKVMLELKSSHAYFIIQLACGEIDWTTAEDILHQVLGKKK